MINQVCSNWAFCSKNQYKSKSITTVTTTTTMMILNDLAKITTELQFWGIYIYTDIESNKNLTK